ncbi:hypothetical protein GGD83_000742 [Rhodoblastus sphagnicola]|uniref:hypothetical protein n=1 Tax=Rhodoblastus sphagnicola TaxID=333368 RepID=UPI0011B0E65E|nr:hypothetical protein [Rhodoblastus sphagnicola]MBB4196965.1 hypothetical protein [Rhodoblastus sphagnicola]
MNKRGAASAGNGVQSSDAKAQTETQTHARPMREARNAKTSLTRMSCESINPAARIKTAAIGLTTKIER